MRNFLLFLSIFVSYGLAAQCGDTLFIWNDSFSPKGQLDITSLIQKDLYPEITFNKQTVFVTQTQDFLCEATNKDKFCPVWFKITVHI